MEGREGSGSVGEEAGSGVGEGGSGVGGGDGWGKGAERRHTWNWSAMILKAKPARGWLSSGFLVICCSGSSTAVPCTQQEPFSAFSALVTTSSSTLTAYSYLKKQLSSLLKPNSSRQ